MSRFSVTFERVNESEACAGESDRCGFIVEGVRLRYAVDALRLERSSMRDDSGEALWVHEACFTTSSYEFQTGDQLTLTIHWPRTVSRASGARLGRLLCAIL